MLTESACAAMFGILSTLSLPQPLLDPRPAIPLSESSQKAKAKVTVMSDHSDKNPLAWVPHTCIVIEKSLAGRAPLGSPRPCAPLSAPLCSRVCVCVCVCVLPNPRDGLVWLRGGVGLRA